MLGQRRRRWPNIKTALDQCLVWVVSCNQLSGYINAVNVYSIGYCWPTLDSPRHARFEAEWFFNPVLLDMIFLYADKFTLNFTHLKLWVAVAIHNSKWVKI